MYVYENKNYIFKLSKKANVYILIHDFHYIRANYYSSV